MTKYRDKEVLVDAYNIRPSRSHIHCKRDLTSNNGGRSELFLWFSRHTDHFVHCMDRFRTQKTEPHMKLHSIFAAFLAYWPFLQHSTTSSDGSFFANMLQ